MKKAAAKPAPVSLGKKRTCPKCALKFYDFEKDPIQCPKCATQVDPDAELQLFKKPEAKKKKEPVRDDEDSVVVSTEEFESVDDLGDDDDESLENLAEAEDDDEEN